MAKSAHQAIALFLIGISAAIGLLALPAPAAAATCTWTGAGGDARWSNSSNWTGCPKPANGDGLVFPANAPPQSENDIAGLSLTTLSLTGIGAGSSYVISGLEVTITTYVYAIAPLDVDGNGPTLALPLRISPTEAMPVVVGSRLAITGTITGSVIARLMKDGTGTLILANPANAWNRMVHLGGTVQIGVAGALPANSLVDMSSTGAVLDLNNIDTTIGGLQGGIAPPNGSGTIFLGIGTLTITGPSSYNGQIIGAGRLVKTGPSDFTLSGPVSNTYTGTTTVNEGTLRLSMNAPGVNAIAGPIIVNGGTLRLDKADQIADTAAVTVNSPGLFDVGNFTGDTIGSLAGNGSVTLGVAALAVGANNSSTTFAGTISGLSESPSRTSLRKVGAGTLTLTGTNTYEGSTRIEAGTLLVNGSIASGPFNDVVLWGGTLGGVGTVARIYAPDADSKVSPGMSPGILHVTGAHIRGTYVVELNGYVPGSGYDQLDVTEGPVDLTTATLQVSRGFGPPLGTSFTIIKQPEESSTPVIGTFAGLPEGAELTIGSQRFSISYHGGFANDVVLTALEIPPILTINDVTVTEGDSGTTDAVFTVTLSRALAETISVQYATANGTAAAPNDYTSQGGTLVFLPGTMAQTVIVPVTGDRDVEPDETFLVRLFGLSGPAGQGLASIGREQGIGTVAGDDFARTYFLSEGSTGSFFDEDILIANPNDTIAPVTLTFLKENGEQVVARRSIGAQSHVTVHAELIPGLEATAASVQVTSESGVPLIVERTMFWDKTYYAGHTGSSVDGAAQDWLFAEGSQGFFDTFILVANPHATATDVTFTFLPETGGPIVVTRTVAPTSRLTLHAGDIPELVYRSFGVAVHATQPITAERSMYFGTTPGRLWSGGTESAGVTAAATHWFLAEGATGGFFQTFILLSNPQSTQANVAVKYLLDSGETLTVPKVVPPNGRVTINIEAEGDERLHNAAVSTVVTSDLPIIAERSMYWSAPPWHEAHNSFGVVDLGTRWGLAEGRVGGALHFHTYILLANPQSSEAQVTVTYLREEGAPIVRQYTVPPTSRFNIDVNAIVPEMRDESFGALIEVTNGVPIAAERSMYWDSQGVFWSGGTNATGTRLP
jgi:autotransporter-associated beta strand protein